MLKNIFVMSVLCCSFLSTFAMDNGERGFGCDADWNFNIAESPTKFLLQRLDKLRASKRCAKCEVRHDSRNLFEKVRDAINPNSPKCHDDGAFHVWEAQELCQRCHHQEKEIHAVLKKRWEIYQQRQDILDKISREEKEQLQEWYNEKEKSKCHCMPHVSSSRLRAKSLPAAEAGSVPVERKERSKSLSGGNYAGLTFPSNENKSNK